MSTLLPPELKESGRADHNPELGLVQGHGEGLATGLCRTLAPSPVFSSSRPSQSAWLSELALWLEILDVAWQPLAL